MVGASKHSPTRIGKIARRPSLTHHGLGNTYIRNLLSSTSAGGLRLFAAGNDEFSFNRHNRCGICVAAFVILSLAPSFTRADTKSSREYEVKAAFVFHFAQFVDWPDSAFSSSDAPICIGIIGTDPFGSLLDQIVQGETVHSRKFVVKRANNVEDLKNCHLLFISKTERGQIPQILNALGNAPVLTVSETEGFANQGGGINFYIADNKVRFEINPEAAKRRGLKISSKLLGLGTVVH